MNTQRVEGHTPTLKSCPFCGGPAIISEHRETVGHGETATSAVITCGDWERKGCGATVSGLAENLHEPDSRRAIQKWNRRASIERLEKVNEALVRALETANENLSGWCDAIDKNGTGWDDWDEWFKDAKYERGGKPSVLSVIQNALALAKEPV